MQPPTSLPYTIQTWTFGDDLGMVFLPGEVVVDYSLRLKKELGADLWVTAYANDVPCYIASGRVISEGGYEVDGSMPTFDKPTRLAVETEELIVGAVHELLPERAKRASETSTNSAVERPNILWITCEDMSPNLGCYGDAYAVTPNLDRLAGQGCSSLHRRMRASAACDTSPTSNAASLMMPSYGRYVPARYVNWRYRFRQSQPRLSSPATSFHRDHEFNRAVNKSKMTASYLSRDNSTLQNDSKAHPVWVTGRCSISPESPGRTAPGFHPHHRSWGR